MHIQNMRIYTNFDGYMAINHDVSLGGAVYKDMGFDLDDAKSRHGLIETLVKDEIIEQIDEQGRDIATRGHAYKVIHPDYRFLNWTRDGKANRMQETALLLNLKQSTHLIIPE